jgi:RNA polymerase sigma-70 factor (ECF subfamily)
LALPHLDSVYRMARALGSDAAEADDLVQETFTRAYRAFDRFELHEFGAKPWLLRILQNVFYTAKGKQRREPRLLEDIDLSHFVDELSWSERMPVSAGGLDWDHFDEELKSAVAQLQPEYRIVLLLWSIEGLSYREIADLCECALGTVMSRLYRARRTVGRRLCEYARERKLSTARFE